MSQAKLERYLRIRDQLADLVHNVADPLAQRATAVALLHHKLSGVSWTGFYLLHHGELVVDAYQGPLACLTLPSHQGVCWAAVDRNESVIVPDVNLFEGHIPCDARTRSEIVIPLRGAQQGVVGVLDIDSQHLAHFDEVDQQGLESIVGLLQTEPDVPAVFERFRLDGQVAIISGAGRGIGRAVALALSQAGARVLCAARTAAEIESVADEAQSWGAQALALPCDVSDTGQIDAVIKQTMDSWGRLDILVNVAGGTMPSPALQTSQRVLEEAFHFNVGSAFHFSRRTIPHMLASGGGAIVNISSALSHLVEKGFVAYGTAKAALNHMTRLLAHEFAPKVRVNALAVGSVLTDALAPFLAGDLQQQMEQLTPMERLGTPDDIATAVLYLVSPAASWVTGKVFEIDGGTVASNWPLKMPAY